MDYSYGSVVFRKTDRVEYLLVKHAVSGHWGFPKGHPDTNETPHETAIREILEETNTVVRIVAGFEEIIEYVLPMGEDKRVTFFLAEFLAEDSVVINPGEIAGLEWLPYEQAVSRITYDDTRSVLARCDSFVSELSD